MSSTLDKVHLRRLLNVIKDSVEKSLEGYLFQPDSGIFKYDLGGNQIEVHAETGDVYIKLAKPVERVTYIMKLGDPFDVQSDEPL